MVLIRLSAALWLVTLPPAPPLLACLLCDFPDFNESDGSRGESIATLGEDRSYEFRYGMGMGVLLLGRELGLEVRVGLGLYVVVVMVTVGVYRSHSINTAATLAWARKSCAASRLDWAQREPKPFFLN